MNSDGVIYNQEFNIQHTIDEKLKDPNLKLKFGNNEFSLAEINNIFPTKEKKIDMFIEWDNMCQYSCIGLVTKINELIKENRKINFHDFLRRDIYPNAIDYVKKVIFPELDSKLIDKVMIKYYNEIMAKSPVTDFFNKLNLMKFMLNSVTFMFRYNVRGLDDFVNSISSEKFNNEVTCKYVVYETEDQERYAIKELPIKEIYIVPDMGLYYQAMIEYDKENTTIMGYNNHTGISPYILAYYFNEFEKVGLNGPNDIKLSFLQEYLPTEEELKQEFEEQEEVK